MIGHTKTNRDYHFIYVKYVFLLGVDNFRKGFFEKPLDFKSKASNKKSFIESLF